MQWNFVNIGEHKSQIYTSIIYIANNNCNNNSIRAQVNEIVMQTATAIQTTVSWPYIIIITIIVQFDSARFGHNNHDNNHGYRRLFFGRNLHCIFGSQRRNSAVYPINKIYRL